MNGGASGLTFSITEPHGERILEKNISNGEGSKGYFYIYENVGKDSKVTFGPTWGWGSWFVIGIL